MNELSWTGVMPAITTRFREDGSIDHAFVAKHVSWLVDHGCTGIVPCGSLGEGTTLSFDEKSALIDTCVSALDGRVPVIPGIASLSTGEAVRLAQRAKEVGASGLMVLPPYVHVGTWRENRAHFDALFAATDLPCMLYNNPIAYGTDVLPEQVAQLAEDHDNFRALKDSGGDARRITALRVLLGDRLALFAGLDDMVVEGVQAGAVGWIAGLVNALPKESVELFELARDGEGERCSELYRWFLPLLRLDCVPQFVQLIKLVQQEVGMGSEAVRLPRLVLEGEDRHRALATIRTALEARP